ncbi:ATPase family associated with various cellular activities (AAA) [Rubripirellula tenax]|uniref:ATPase family associated with various cellular activities (AAA) n=1 Tax=Rubripirellula tenax TaxID=2528015 RepID=A0A5C6F1D7_9BACT|nr:MoxR family ATPase [Rubripirellula tenax]TWU54875.1 ATPase family associated with various cellular activities (AAA) [Rubripirellula tenax]
MTSPINHRPSTQTVLDGASSDDALARAVADHRATYQQICDELAKSIVGMEDVIEQLMIAILCRGHCILQGMPGLAKTLLISQLAQLMEMSFSRIQFTPDLMPADITGGEVLEEDRTTGKRAFRFVKGPVFSHFLLADEINRTPPKSQSALLEAMEERQLSIAGTTHRLPDPFFVLATQNPVEVEGTYPLPEAQLDRFLLKIHVNYPSRDAELEICRRAARRDSHKLRPVLTAEKLLAMQDLTRRVVVGEQVFAAAVDLVRMTRPEEGLLPASLQPYIQYGGGPRASLALVSAARARALLQGRHHATTKDVLSVAKPVLRHRIIPTFNAESDGFDADVLIEKLISHATKKAVTPPPKA